MTNSLKAVHIPQNLDLNDFNPAQAYKPVINPAIYNDLPELLQRGVFSLVDAKEREVFLVGALGVGSGMLHGVKGLYHGRTVHANLFVFVQGDFGSGKSALRYARMLGYHAHKSKLDAYTEHTDATEPAARKMLFLPANSSRTGIMELLQANDGHGIIFETEGDTLTETLKADYGNFSDVLRKGAHHEPISYYRRGGKEYGQIEAPAFSVVLSGTRDQLKSLIPSTENGLFSRFLLFALEPDFKFANVFDQKMSGYEYTFNELGREMAGIYSANDELAKSDGLTFELTPDQQIEFLQFFENALEENLDIAPGLNGLIRRLGLNCFRIAMTLTAIRQIKPNGDVFSQPQALICDDRDFYTALELTRVFAATAVEMFVELPGGDNIGDKEQALLNALEANFKRGDAIREAAALQLGVSDSTIDKWLKKWATAHKITSLGAGKYRRGGMRTL